MGKLGKCKLQNFISEILEKDMKYFSLSRDKICNIIIQQLGFENNQSFHKKVLDKSKNWYFNLSAKNAELLNEMLRINQVNQESEFYRKVFSTYANFHPFLRERILNIELFSKVENAIKNNYKLKIYYKKNVLIDVFPISFERDSNFYTILKAIDDKEKEIKLEMRYVDVLKVG